MADTLFEFWFVPKLFHVYLITLTIIFLFLFFTDYDNLTKSSAIFNINWMNCLRFKKIKNCQTLIINTFIILIIILIYYINWISYNYLALLFNIIFFYYFNLVNSFMMTEFYQLLKEHMTNYLFAQIII